MDETTKELITPGGMPDKQENPLSSETGSMDSGGSQLLLNKNEITKTLYSPFQRRDVLRRSPTSKKPGTSKYPLLPTTRATSVEGINNIHYEDIVKELQESRQQNAALNATIKRMEEHIKVLEKEVRKLNENEKMDCTLSATEAQYQKSHQAIEYITDEEELAKETEWLRVKQRRKKRKLNNTPSPPKLQELEKAETKAKEALPKKMPPPPPVIIDGIRDYDSLYEKIKTIVPDDKFKTKLMTGNNIKINVENGETYRELTKMLTAEKHAWHSYENKQIRPIRVMAIKLHHTCKPEKIVDDLKARGLKAIGASIRMKLQTKQPLNMFMLTFSSDESIEKVYQIKTILGCKVDIQPLRRSKLIPQCKKCQSYGHTQAYCNKEPRCVKCIGKHYTRDCLKTKDELPKCVHCGENHPANYRGCKVAIELQRMKNKNLESKKAGQRQTSKTNNRKNPRNIAEAVVDGKFTYAQVTARSAHQGKVSSDTHNVDQMLQTILNKLNSFDERLQRLEYSNKGAIPKQRNV